MSYKAKTSIELNRYHIIKTLKKLKLGKVSVQLCDLNKRFKRMKTEDEGWYDQLYKEYVNTVKGLNNKIAGRSN